MSIFKSIRELEEELEGQISDSQGSPFIAHCDVRPELEETALQELVEQVGGKFSNFLRLMPKFPYVCARVIATTLAGAYGTDGSQKVYDLIANRLCTDGTISQNHHRHFFNQFRRSCERIGLALPSANVPRMVSSYLFQAGVSQSQLPVLADAFLKAERLLGLPLSDDTRDLDEWEDRAVDLAPSGHKVLRRIVKEDPTAYHAISYVRLRRDNDYPISDFEREFQKAIEKSSQSSQSGRKTVDTCPALEFSDGELWITLPQGAHRLEVKIDGHIHPLSPGLRLALPLPWPPTIRWRPSGTDTHNWEPLHILNNHQEILVFDGESGIYKKSLNPGAKNKQSVRAGQLCLLSRVAFAVNEEYSHRLDNEAFVLFCTISTEMVIERYDLQFNVDIEERLRMEVFGKKIVRNRKGWLLGGAISVQIYGRGVESSELLEVRLQHPAINGIHRYAVCSNPNGDLVAKLGMPRNGDFGLAQISLHIQGQDRRLYRTNFWYWPGLKRLMNERLFIATSIPRNLAEKQLLHIGRDSQGRLVLLEGDPYLRARLCFSVKQNSVKRKLVNFTLPPPGASVSVRRPDGSERALKLGASLFVRDDYASSLIVRYSDPMAKIDLKGEVIPTAFGKTGMWRVSFATLKQEGTHNRVCLIPDRELTSPLDLVQVVPEVEPRSFRAQQYGNVWALEADFERPIDAVQIKAENLISGEKLSEEVMMASLSDHLDELNLMTVIRTNFPNRLKIEIPQDSYMDGIWFVRLHVLEKASKDWLPVINSSGESYATCIASNSFAQKLFSADVSTWCKEDQQAQAFLRLSRVIYMPIYRSCYANVKELALNAWRQLGNLLGAHSHPTSLLKACVLPPSSHAPETWTPVFHPVEVAPELFAVPAEDIAILASSEQPEYEEFELVGLAGITESLLDAVDVLDISWAFLLSFSGASDLQVDHNASPGIFDFSQYCEYARTIEQMTDDEKPLSIWHHDRVCQRMADRIEIARQDRFASNRLNNSTKILKYFTGPSYKGLDIPEDLIKKSLLIRGASRLIAAISKAWRIGNTEKFWDDLRFKSNLSMREIRKHVGTILRLAPELLAFYLLLWVLVEKHERR